VLNIKNLQWFGNAASGWLRILDQTRLPSEVAYLDCTDVQAVWDAIKSLSVRGAPAIGIAAGYCCVLGVRGARYHDPDTIDPEEFKAALTRTASFLSTSRPTAVNLSWALDRMKQVDPCTPDTLLVQAKAIHEEDAMMCRRIGQHGLGLIGQGIEQGSGGILTHCNAGALATGGIGTATAPMYLAREKGLPIKVYVDETRPLLQGSRLTAYELAAAGIDVTVICDSAAAQVIGQGDVGLVITGADRIASNGDTANKIGTYSLAILARHHGVPFYVAAPSTTFDLTLLNGSAIPIEHRPASEITHGFGRRTAPADVDAYCPAFDVTPHDLITAIITEQGLIQPVDSSHVKAMIEMR